MAKMSEEDFKRFLSSEVANSLNYIDSKIAKRRELILNYIQLQMPDFPRRPGGSGVVDGTVGSQIGLMMPNLMRIMCGGPLVGEYEATGRGDDVSAKEATEYVNNVVLKQDNDVERIFYDWGYDGLTQILGIVKGYWEEDIEETEETFEGLSSDQMAMLFMRLQQDPAYSITAYEETAELVQDETGAQVRVASHTLTVKKTVNRSKVKLHNIPPEEFVVSVTARSLEESILKSHRTYKRAGDLKEMGFKASVVDALPTYEPFREAQEQLNRSGLVWEIGSTATKDDPDMREIAVHEGIIKCNYDGKGIRDHYFIAAGNDETIEILKCEPYDDQIQFYDFCPQPLPHTIFGRCPGDDLVQIQQIRTAILRPTIDNLNQANTPQRIVAPTQLEKGGLEALINRVPGGIVLSKNVELAVKELATPFFAQHSFPMLDFFEQEADKRTGVSRASMGLDPDTLQRQTATATQIAQSASMGKVEMIARIWAVGVRKMMRGILRILKKYQDFPRVVKVAGKLQPVEPGKWAAFDDWDVTINTGLGTGSKERDIATASFLASKIEQLILQAGPNNPIAGLGQLAHAYRQIAELSGVKRADDWFRDVPRDFQMPQTEAPPDPKLVAAQAKIQEGQAKLQLESQKAQATVQLERAKAGEQIRVAREVEAAKADAALRKIDMEYALKLQQMEREYALRLMELERESALELVAIEAKSASGQGQIPNGDR